MGCHRALANQRLAPSIDGRQCNGSRSCCARGQTGLLNAQKPRADLTEPKPAAADSGSSLRRQAHRPRCAEHPQAEICTSTPRPEASKLTAFQLMTNCPRPFVVKLGRRYVPFCRCCKMPRKPTCRILGADGKAHERAEAIGCNGADEI